MDLGTWTHHLWNLHMYENKKRGMNIIKMKGCVGNVVKPVNKNISEEGLLRLMN